MTVIHRPQILRCSLLLEVPMNDVLVMNVLQAACKVLQGDQDHSLRIRINTKGYITLRAGVILLIKFPISL